jgi:hypothetical protein
MKIEQTECSKTLALKVQTPVNHPEERIQHPYELLTYRYIPHDYVFEIEIVKFKITEFHCVFVQDASTRTANMARLS